MPRIIQVVKKVDGSGAEVTIRQGPNFGNDPEIVLALAAELAQAGVKADLALGLAVEAVQASVFTDVVKLGLALDTTVIVPFDDLMAVGLRSDLAKAQASYNAGVGLNVGVVQSVCWYDAPGTYTFTVPDFDAAQTELVVRLWAAGGAGSPNSSGTRRGGSGGGGFVESTLTKTPGDTFTLVVGAGGETLVSRNVGSASGNGYGERSYFDDPDTGVRAGGGRLNDSPTAGGEGGGTHADNANVGDTTFNGGSGANSNAFNQTGGGGGGGAGDTEDGTDGSNQNGGTGGDAEGGEGGDGGAALVGDLGDPGAQAGGGSGGKGATATGAGGGKGGDGLAIIKARPA